MLGNKQPELFPSIIALLESEPICSSELAVFSTTVILNSKDNIYVLFIPN